MLTQIRYSQNSPLPPRQKKQFDSDTVGFSEHACWHIHVDILAMEKHTTMSISKYLYWCCWIKDLWPTWPVYVWHKRVTQVVRYHTRDVIPHSSPTPPDGTTATILVKSYKDSKHTYNRMYTIVVCILRMMYFHVFPNFLGVPIKFLPNYGTAICCLGDNWQEKWSLCHWRWQKVLQVGCAPSQSLAGWSHRLVKYVDRL